MNSVFSWIEGHFELSLNPIVEMWINFIPVLQCLYQKRFDGRFCHSVVERDKKIMKRSFWEILNVWKARKKVVCIPKRLQRLIENVILQGMVTKDIENQLIKKIERNDRKIEDVNKA